MAAGLGRGRTAKPVALHRLDNRSKIGLADAVNPPLIEVADADKWRDALLDSELEKTLWNLYVDEGRAAKLLATMDAPMLAALCKEQAVYFLAAKEVGKAAVARQWGKLVAEKGGAYLGAMAIGNKALEKSMQLAAQFGGMPGARAKLAALDTQMGIDFDALMDVQPEDMSDEELDEAIAASGGAVARLR